MADSGVRTRSVEAAIRTLGTLSTEEHPELDDAARDSIGEVIEVLERIVERRQGR